MTLGIIRISLKHGRSADHEQNNWAYVSLSRVLASRDWILIVQAQYQQSKDIHCVRSEFWGIIPVASAEMSDTELMCMIQLLDCESTFLPSASSIDLLNPLMNPGKHQRS